MPVTIEGGEDEESKNEVQEESSDEEVAQVRREWLEREALWLATEAAARFGQIESSSGTSDLERMNALIEKTAESLIELDCRTQESHGRRSDLDGEKQGPCRVCPIGAEEHR